MDQRFNIAANASSFRSISARSSSAGIAYAHSISYSRGQSDSHASPQATSSPGATVVPDAEAFRFDAALRFSEIALVLVRFDHVAGFIVNANHCAMSAVAMLQPVVRLFQWIQRHTTTPSLRRPI